MVPRVKYHCIFTVLYKRKGTITPQGMSHCETSTVGSIVDNMIELQRVFLITKATNALVNHLFPTPQWLLAPTT